MGRHASNRPVFLLRWVESLDVGPVVDTSNLAALFRDGLYLLRILQRLAPTQKFVGVRWRPRSEASCIANLELALSFIWQKSVRASKMSSSSDLYRATTPDKWLYVLNIVFEAFVFRDLKSTAKETLTWYQTVLNPFGMALRFFAQSTQQESIEQQSTNTTINTSIHAPSGQSYARREAVGQGAARLKQRVRPTTRIGANSNPTNTSMRSTYNASGGVSVYSSDISMNSGMGVGLNTSIASMSIQKQFGGRETRISSYLKYGLYEDFQNCVNLFCVVDTYCRSIERAGGYIVSDRPSSTAIYRYPTDKSKRLSNATVVFSILNSIGIPMFWTAEEWVEYQDIGFMLFQLELIRAALMAPIPSITSMSSVLEGETLNLQWKDDALIQEPLLDMNVDFDINQDEGTNTIMDLNTLAANDTKIAKNKAEDETNEYLNSNIIRPTDDFGNKGQTSVDNGEITYRTGDSEYTKSNMHSAVMEVEEITRPEEAYFDEGYELNRNILNTEAAEARSNSRNIRDAPMNAHSPIVSQDPDGYGWMHSEQNSKYQYASQYNTREPLIKTGISMIQQQIEQVRRELDYGNGYEEEDIVEINEVGDREDNDFPGQSAHEVDRYQGTRFVPKGVYGKEVDTVPNTQNQVQEADYQQREAAKHLSPLHDIQQQRPQIKSSPQNDARKDIQFVPARYDSYEQGYSDNADYNEDNADAIESMLNLSHPDGFNVHLIAPVDLRANVRLMGIQNTLSGPALGNDSRLRITDLANMKEYYVNLLEIKNVSVTKCSVILSSGAVEFTVGSKCIILDFEGPEAISDSQIFAEDLSKVLSEVYMSFLSKKR